MQQDQNPSPEPGAANAGGKPQLPGKLWIYTNYDCNLSCSYCVAESSPCAARRELKLATVQQLVDEAVALGFDQVFMTGGEPFMLDNIYDMLAYSLARVRTTVLTNGMLLRGRRLDQLAAIANDNLIVQVSLDGARPEQHDAYRGAGSWAKAVQAIRNLQSRGIRVRVSTTETPANADHLQEMQDFVQALGIPEEDHFSRPLARRGLAQEGIEVEVGNLLPELTVSVDGVFWHPLASPSSDDMQVSKKIFPLAAVAECVQGQLERIFSAPSQAGQARAVT